MNIIDFTNDSFPFDEIKLKTPKALQGGTYSSELTINDKPIIIQTPKCKTKNGIHNTAKISYCDLLMNSDHNEFISLEVLYFRIISSLIFFYSDQTPVVVGESTIMPQFISLVSEVPNYNY